MAVNTDLRLTFPNEKLREDFEMAFRSWLKQYQAGLQGSQQGLGPTAGHSFGFQGGQQGQQGQGQAFASDIVTPYGTIGYLNLIPNW